MSHSTAERPSRSGVVHELDAAQVYALLRARQALLIDVREPVEFGMERIPGALLLPLSEIDPASLPLDGSKRVIFHCGTGRRSGQAVQRLIEAGAGEATHLAGGLRAWKEAGLPLTRLDPATGRMHHVPL